MEPWLRFTAWRKRHRTGDAEGQAERWQSRRHSGNAWRSRGDLFPQPHQPRQARRVGAGTGARRPCAAAPPDVPALEKQDQATIANLTLRQRTELHRTNPVCANCHKVLDPIGFGLENFDAIGRWRDQDENGRPIDAAGELPGGKRFSSPKELKAIIAGRSDDLSRNLVEKLLAYALCRRLEGYDEIVVDNLMQEIAEDGYRMQTLITGS